MFFFKNWIEQCSSRETDDLIAVLVKWHLCQVEDKGLKVRLKELLLKRNRYKLCHHEVMYDEGYSVSDYRHYRQILAFSQKRVDIDIGVDRSEVALAGFMRSEALCAETNRIIRLRNRGEFSFLHGVEPILHSAQRKIALILGDVPSLDELQVRFGPGATTQVKKRFASARRKLGQQISCSEDSLWVLQRTLESVPGLIPFEEESESTLVAPVIDAARLSFVPKSAKTDRVVATEPTLNTLFQLGIGDYISHRLRLSGVDLKDQGLNQALAQIGSITGALATLDLSSASDTISEELVFDLLPVDWAILLSNYRSGKIEMPDGSHLKLAKFSSMGNGYTFALESLIFYALVWACQDTDAQRFYVNVYGDDIITPIETAELVEKVLLSVGFLVNRSKSYSSGPFRESCGKDYFKGIEIRPFYLKDRLSPEILFVLHNYYVRRGDLEPAEIVLSMIPQHLRIFGPDGFGDGHLIGPWFPRPHNRHLGWGGYTFETYQRRANRSYSASQPGDRYLPAYSIYVSSPGEDFPQLPVKHSIGGQYRSSTVEYSYRGDELGTSVPGSKGYRRVFVYTLKK